MSDPITQSMMQGAGGAAAEDPQWVDEVFDIWTYKGTNTTHKRTSSVDNTKGGMIMWSPRTGAGGNRYLYDTVRGVNKSLYPDYFSNGDDRSGNPDMSSFDNNGFTLTGNNINNTVYEAVIWNFRKAPGFFDCFEYTGTGADNNILNHKLKALPGLIVVKRTDASGDWVTCMGPWIGGTEYSFGSSSTQFTWNSNTVTYNVKAFAQIATANTVNVSRLQEISSGTWDVAAADTNASGATYMCYIWAMGANDGTSDAAVYGENQDKEIIRCGIYQGDGSSNKFMNLGWEPQWILYKSVFGGNDDWQIYDSQRGVNYDPLQDFRITLNNAGGESAQGPYVQFEGNGWRITDGNNEVNNSSRRYFYMVIRKPDGIVGKPAEVGTDAFAMDSCASPFNSTTYPAFDANFAPDGTITTNTGSSDHNYVMTRKTGAGFSPDTSGEDYLHTDLTNAASSTSYGGWNRNNGWSTGVWGNSTTKSWMWKSGKGFDVQVYNGTGSVGGAHYHSLGQVPEMIWTKRLRTGSSNWVVGHMGINGGVNAWNRYLHLNNTNGPTQDNKYNYSTPTSTLWTTSSDSDINGSGHTYLAWLFSSVTGISKCGYYQGSYSDTTVTVGFQPRLLFIKRVDRSGDNWIWLDTLRGWGSGNDALRYLNSSGEASPTNLGEPTSTGFTLTTNNGSSNEGGGSYIYYAHA